MTWPSGHGGDQADSKAKPLTSRVPLHQPRGPQAGPPCLRGELGPVFTQLRGGHSLAGSAACSAPALTQQSPPARTHGGHTRARVRADRHTHAQVHTHGTHAHGHTCGHQRNTHGSHRARRAGPRPCSRVPPSGSPTPPALTLTPSASDPRPRMAAHPWSGQPHATGQWPQRSHKATAGTETHTKWT